jgi:hypothetical protein
MKWAFVSLLGISLLGNVALAHEKHHHDHRGSWCDRHPHACEEHRGFHDHEKHRFEKWCKRHPRACQEYRNPPRPIVLVPPSPVIVVPPQPPQHDHRSSWCKRHPHKCEERRHHHH